MGIETNLLSFPEQCSLLEAAKDSDEQAQWLSHVPIWLEDLDGEHPSVLFDARPALSRCLNFRKQQFETPFYAPFRQIWIDYVNLCAVHPGLETRYWI